jgi:hypothetical protein
MKTEAIRQAAQEKLESSTLETEDWFAPKIREDIEPLKAFPVSEVVQAGDGGFWVPVYIYVEKD